VVGGTNLMSEVQQQHAKLKNKIKNSCSTFTLKSHTLLI